MKTFFFAAGIFCFLCNVSSLPFYVLIHWNWNYWMILFFGGIMMNVVAGCLFLWRNKQMDVVTNKKQVTCDGVDADIIRNQFERLVREEKLICNKPILLVVSAVLACFGSLMMLIAIFLYIAQSHVWLLIISFTFFGFLFLIRLK